MIVGAILLELRLEGCRSLKDKRRIIRSLMDKARGQFQVAIAEVDDQELWQNATIGVSCVSNNQTQIESVLQHFLHSVDENPLVEVVGAATEFFRFD
jgi:hypothetical protein